MICTVSHKIDLHKLLEEPELTRPPREDILVAAILTLATAFWGDLWGQGPRLHSYPAAVLTSMGLTLPTVVRRTHPLLMVALTAIAGATQVALLPYPTWSLAAIPVVSYSVARSVVGKPARIVVVAGGLGALAGPLRWSASDSSFDWSRDFFPTTVPLIFLCLAWVVIPYLLGRRDQENAAVAMERTQAARQRYEAQLAQREQATRAAEARIRTDIARELHDIVAHSLSVIVVQAEGGKALARKHPEKAAEVLGTISETGRASLNEMRRIVGVLRSDPDEKAQFAPSPGLPDLAGLVDSYGQRVQLRTTGTTPDVSPAVGLTVYRVVQEALTNVLKHAGGQANALVDVKYQTTQIELTITDDGGNPGDSLPAEVGGSGFGVQGMQERVAAMGGRISVGPHEAGWQVHVVLPTRTSLTEAASNK